jgi:mannan endo-1,4-beta-mannosidase
MKLFFLILLGNVLLSCVTRPSENLSHNSADKLFEQLKAIKNKGILFGHQDDLAYGVHWKYEEGRSDTYETVGDYPALFGWELGGIELGHSVNLDSVPFDKMHEFVLKGYQMGAVITFSWHPYSAVDTTKSAWDNDHKVVKHIIPGGSHHEVFKDHLDKVAAFFLSLRTAEGQQIPFIFRPWHEMDGGWFWWGSTLCTPDEVKKLFRFTIEYLRNDKGLNFLSAYSPDNHFNSEEEYLTWYPGDDIVDIMGMDNYGDFRVGSENLEAARQKLEIVVGYAEKTDKIAAFTETGLDRMTDNKWFTQKLGEAFPKGSEAEKIAYVMLWRNADTTHFFSTYPGHSSAADFKKFVRREKVWLLEDWNRFKKENKLE